MSVVVTFGNTELGSNAIPHLSKVFPINVVIPGGTPHVQRASMTSHGTMQSKPAVPSFSIMAKLVYVQGERS